MDYTAEGDDSRTSDHVCASGVVAYSGEETFLFPCDDPGVDPPITSFHELYPGSFRSAIDHAQALADAGYAIADPAVTTPRSA